MYKHRRIKAQKGWPRTGHTDPRGVPALRKYKNLKCIQKNKSLVREKSNCRENLIAVLKNKKQNIYIYYTYHLLYTY